MTQEQIDDVVRRLRSCCPSRPGGRARRGGDPRRERLPLHAVPVSAANDRKDAYGGSLENRARLLLDVVRAIRREVGLDFHLQVKICATEYGNAFFPWAAKGNTIEDSVQVGSWLEEAGADAIHVSAGNAFPHPRNPAGAFSAREVVRTYDTMLSNGRHTFRNYLMFRIWPLNRIAEWRWSDPPSGWRAPTFQTLVRSRRRCRSPCSAPAASRPPR